MKRTSAILVSAALGWTIAYASELQHREVPGLDLSNVLELSLGALEPVPADPSNRWADNPAAAKLGARLFFDVRLSSNARVSCASCHDPRLSFQDGLPLAKGVGTSDRRTMPIAGTAYSPFLFWDGRKDSQWAQALGPLENPVEHGGTRADYAHVIATHYRSEFEQLFGPLPNLEKIPGHASPNGDRAARAAWRAMRSEERVAVTDVFVNIGKALAAYERTIRFAPTRFDHFAAEWQRRGAMPLDILDPKELRGLGLFIGKANCTQCHNGPLLTNNEFHNTGVALAPGLPMDRGRATGIEAVKNDEFGCYSRWSDAKREECAELEFLTAGSALQERAFKVPSLRNVAQRAPYMHAGQLSTLRAVLNHYNDAPHAPAGHSELKPLRLSETELDELEAFLHALNEESLADQSPAPVHRKLLTSAEGAQL